ncbi:feruloyl CoA ortho-hydroxylase F6H1-3-like [Magnolia sinica]|uniref:feruloyl CoA ortho-hydroxylase F6H1-3-like n=1 Tax=Magnolia sinica TaxID=86752 RepID=UPI0026583154|nr:feruloyl CoA ortho-hydroxylase F6H1-3-like [Magnolia sinica]
MGCEVDRAFIQAVEHRPKPTIIEAGGIPLIDLSPLNSVGPGGLQSLSGLIAEVGAACRDWGFFQVINHGVPLDLLDQIGSAAKQFFALSPEEKQKVRRDEVNSLGYYDTEHTKNVRDWKEVFDFVVHDPTVIPASYEPDDQEVQELRNRWPTYPPELR